jgi:hypothetical protein
LLLKPTVLGNRFNVAIWNSYFFWHVTNIYLNCLFFSTSCLWIVSTAVLTSQLFAGSQAQRCSTELEETKVLILIVNRMNQDEQVNKHKARIDVIEGRTSLKILNIYFDKFRTLQSYWWIRKIIAVFLRVLVL